MKQILLLLFLMGLNFGVFCQSLIGAWEHEAVENEKTLKTIVIFSEGYQVATTYNTKTGEFIATNGGKWTLKHNILSETVEFHTEEPKLVGRTVSFEIALTDKTLKIVDKDITFNKIDNGMPGELQGAWLMSGRIRNGVTQQRDTNRPRKTMKILSGTRFQWIAYNTETKEFKGTGGGTYITKNGKYIETIEFFSRDNSRVGASLKFNFEMIDGKWHHSGLSSKGNPIHEIWSLRQ